MHWKLVPARNFPSPSCYCTQYCSVPRSPLFDLVHQIKLASLQKELNNPSLHAVQNHLQNWARANPPTPATMGRCSILPAIHDLLMNLTLPNEGPPYTGQSM